LQLSFHIATVQSSLSSSLLIATRSTRANATSERSYGLFPVRRYVGLRIVSDRVVRHRVFNRFFLLLSGRFGWRQGRLAGGLPPRPWGRLGWRPGRRHGNRPCLIGFRRERLSEVHMFLQNADGVARALGRCLRTRSGAARAPYRPQMRRRSANIDAESAQSADSSSVRHRKTIIVLLGFPTRARRRG
jgi:hypothetical protein